MDNHLQKKCSRCNNYCSWICEVLSEDQVKTCLWHSPPVKRIVSDKTLAGPFGRTPIVVRSRKSQEQVDADSPVVTTPLPDFFVAQ